MLVQFPDKPPGIIIMVEGVRRQVKRIVVLERGRVIQIGTHQDLLAQEGQYRRLWAVQSRHEEELKSDLREAQGDSARGTA